MNRLKKTIFIFSFSRLSHRRKTTWPETWTRKRKGPVRFTELSLAAACFGHTGARIMARGDANERGYARKHALIEVRRVRCASQEKRCPTCNAYSYAGKEASSPLTPSRLRPPPWAWEKDPRRWTGNPGPRGTSARGRPRLLSGWFFFLHCRPHRRWVGGTRSCELALTSLEHWNITRSSLQTQVNQGMKEKTDSFLFFYIFIYFFMFSYTGWAAVDFRVCEPHSFAHSFCVVFGVVTFHCFNNTDITGN